MYPLVYSSGSTLSISMAAPRRFKLTSQFARKFRVMQPVRRAGLIQGSLAISTCVRSRFSVLSWLAGCGGGLLRS
jgi:hypothetical protein